MAAGALVFLALIYRESVHVPLIFDDHPAIERNATIRRLGPLVLSPPVTAAGATGRPLVNLSLALNYAWGGLNVTGYHLFNLAVHGLGGLVLWGWLRRTLPKWAGPRAEAIAGWTAWLWLVHPLQSESVICIVQRNELLAGLFYLLTLYAFARSAETPAPRRWLAVAVAACLAGVLSKEVVATAPLMVLLYDRTFLAGTFREAWRLRWKFYLALAATWVPLGGLMLGTAARAGTVGFGLGTSGWSYLLTQCKALGIYLKLAVWPHPLVLDYGMETVAGPGAVWPQALLVAGLLAGTGWALWKKPVWGFFGAWFFAILAPSSSFVPLTTQTIAEHRMYLPLLPAVLAVVLAVDRVRWRGALTGALVLGCGGLTWMRVRDYRTEAAIWEDTAAKVPENARAHASLGHVLAGEGRWGEAAASYEAALRLRPDYADAHNDYGNVLVQLGKKSAALAHYESARKLKPDDPVIRFNLGTALAAAGRSAEAAEHFAAVVGNEPEHAAAWAALGDAYLQSGRPAEAAAALGRAVKLRPEVPELHYNLGNIWLELGRTAEAVAALGEAVALKPDWAAAHNNLALALVRAGRPGEAVAHYEATLRLMPGIAQVHQNFALALEQLGRVAEAVAQDQAALRIDPADREARAHLDGLRRRR